MDKIQKLSIIGGGSWATALVKIFSESNIEISWFLRNAQNVAYIKEHGRNPGYLPYTSLVMDKLYPTADIDEAVSFSDIIFFVVPSAYLPATVTSAGEWMNENKIVITSIKGMVPGANLSATEYLSRHLPVKVQDIVVFGGPCHAEEVAMERKTYVTVSSRNAALARELASCIQPSYIQTIVNADPVGVEYAAILKNIIGLACGMSHGLNYGDNFQAVLVSNAFTEIRRFLQKIDSSERELSDSAYFGDLLVTAYSAFSRNRTFGQMVGRGYSVQAAQMQMNMVAEGYYAVNGIYHLARKLGIEMPVTSAIYRILYNHMPPHLEFRLLEKKFK